MIMSEEARKAQRAYQKKWRDANPDKVRAKNRRYWEKKAREAQNEQTEENQSECTNATD